MAVDSTILEKPKVNVVSVVCPLTKREIEVISLVCEGKSHKEVAAALACSKRTVDYHLVRIYVKLGVSNRVQAFHRATALGIISFPE